jgi:hypothetical protein
MTHGILDAYPEDSYPLPGRVVFGFPPQGAA